MAIFPMDEQLAKHLMYTPFYQLELVVYHGYHLAFPNHLLTVTDGLPPPSQPLPTAKDAGQEAIVIPSPSRTSQARAARIHF